MATTTSVRREQQVTSGDPDRAVRVLEAHLGRPLARWQRFLVVAMLTPAELWDKAGDAEP